MFLTRAEHPLLSLLAELPMISVRRAMAAMPIAAECPLARVASV